MALDTPQPSNAMSQDSLYNPPPSDTSPSTSLTTNQSAATTPKPKPKPTLLTLPAELRNRIYAYATSHPLPTPTPSRLRRGYATPDLIKPNPLPALAQTSRQLRHEVPPIYFDTNTFILTSPTHLRYWLPCKSPESLNKVHIDLASSVSLGWTLREHGLQPIKILEEGAGDEDGEGEKELVVVWASTVRGMELMVEEGGKGTMGRFLSMGQLVEALRRSRGPQGDGKGKK